MLNIREATISDVARLIQMSSNMHKESDYSDMEFSPEKLANQIVRHIKRSDHLAIVADDDGVMAMLFAHITESMFGSDLIANDWAVYVSKERRGGRAAMLMIKEYVSWAKNKNVKRAYLGTTTGVNSSAFIRLAEHFKFENGGTLMNRRF